MGALTHAPRHSTSVSVNMPSALVSPFLIPRCCSIACITSYAPQTMHGVVAHSWMWNLPRFWRLYMVKKVATSYTAMREQPRRSAIWFIAASGTQPPEPCGSSNMWMPSLAGTGLSVLFASSSCCCTTHSAGMMTLILPCGVSG